MKKAILILAMASSMLTSCMSSLPKPHCTVSCLDYSRLTSKGIFVTESNSVSFEYKAIGSILVTSVGGWTKENVKKKDYDGAKIEYKKDSYVGPNVEEAFDALAGKLEKMDANGIINLKIISMSSNTIQISGMAIKR